MSETSWATLRLCAPAQARDVPDLLDALDSVGAMLAADSEVGGVQTCDPREAGDPEMGFEAVAVPELVVYTTPPHLSRLEARALTLARAMGIEVRCSSEVRADENWRDAWKAYYQAMVVAGGALVIRPSWIDPQPGEPELALSLDPGHAFGTGLHDSTRLCLDALTFDPAPQRVLDLGCGSGILGLSAARLWPEAEVLAIDVDADAVETTRENAAINDLSSRVQTRVGSVDDAPDRYDLVLANIRPRVLIPGAAAIAARVAQGGVALLSGILLEEADEVKRAYLEAGLRAGDEHASDEWVALEFHR